MRVVIVIAVLLVSACSTEAYGNHVLDAYTFCKDRGGVARLWSDLGSWHTQCLDGERKYKVGE